jgi:hypothetical protein
MGGNRVCGDVACDVSGDLVGSPKLFEPECRTPRRMQLANALCAYREMAIEVDPNKV